MLNRKNTKETSEVRITLAAMLGNILEYYDFALYGLLSPLIADIFFPHTDKFISILWTFGVYSIGFISRPLGGVIFGYFGDTYGRKNALVVSILLMGLSCCLIGLLPTYEQIGWYSIALLMTARFFQGICMGGEYSGAVVFSLEHNNSQKGRNFSGALIAASTLFGCLLASLVAAFFMYFQLKYFWRIPFLLGGFIGLWGLHIRRKIPETPIFLREKNSNSQAPEKPFLNLWMNYKKRVICAVFLISLAGVNSGFSTTFLSMFLTQELSFDLCNALLIVSFSLTFYIIGALTASYLLTLYSREKILLFISLILIFLSFIVIRGLTSGSLSFLLYSQLAFSIFSGIFWAIINPIIFDFFPPPIRYSGVALSDSIARTAFAGTTPMMLFFSKNYFNSVYAISFYLAFFCIIVISCVFIDIKKGALSAVVK